MNLKTSTNKAIERATIDHNDRVELLGVYGLCDISQPLYYAIKNNTITDCNCFKNTFGFDCSFFYALEQIKDNKVVKYERGLAHLESHDDKTYLIRDIPIITGDDPSNQTVCVGCTPFRCTDCEYLIAYSTVPQIYAENLLDANSIITSVAPFVPHSFVVESDSIVARLDGPVGSFKLQDKTFLDKLIAAISSYSKQIILKTSKLDIKKLSTSLLSLIPSSKSVAKRGSIIYDDKDDTVKYYTGTKWRTLVWQEDEEA